MRKLPRSLDVSLPIVVGVVPLSFVGDGDDGGVDTTFPGPADDVTSEFRLVTLTGMIVTQSSRNRTSSYADQSSGAGGGWWLGFGCCGCFDRTG